MFNFINNLKISTRIVMLSAAPLIGLAAIGGNYLYGEMKIDATIAKANAFSSFAANVDEIGHEVLRMRMVVRGIMIGSSAAQVSELKSLIVSSTQTLSGAMRQDIDPAIAKQVNKLKTLIPKYAAQVSKIEQANNKMSGTNTKGLLRDLDILRNKMMALSEKFGTNEVSRKIIEITALANSYRYSGSFAADATSVKNSTGGSILFADVAKLRTEINGLLVAHSVSLVDRETLGGLLNDYSKQVVALIKVNSDFETAMATQEAIFSEINLQLDPIFSWTEEQLDGHHGGGSNGTQLDQNGLGLGYGRGHRFSSAGWFPVWPQHHPARSGRLHRSSRTLPPDSRTFPFRRRTRRTRSARWPVFWRLSTRTAPRPRAPSQPLRWRHRPSCWSTTTAASLPSINRPRTCSMGPRRTCKR